MRLDGEKDNHSLEWAWSIQIQSLKPKSYLFSREIMKTINLAHTFKKRAKKKKSLVIFPQQSSWQ